MAEKKAKKETKKAEPKKETKKVEKVVACSDCGEDPCACDKSGECGGHSGAPCGPNCIEWGRW